MDLQQRQFAIRREHFTDYKAIEKLLDSAFEGEEEANLVDRIRKTPEYVEELTLVATAGDEIIGFSMLSQVELKGAHRSFPVLALGPVAVQPAIQKHGIGGSLILEGIELCEHRREPLIVVLGHAQYYPRFGFERASIYDIHPPVAWPDESFMVRTLRGWTGDMRGKIVYPASWQIGDSA